MSYDVEAIRQDFPILHQEVHGHPLVYLDNAATTQKPKQVLDVLQHYYERDNANIHRGVHELSLRATQSYEDAREKLQGFMGAAESKELIYTRGTTEAINLVAHSFARPRLNKGDEILVTTMEHHSNIVPWQLVAEETGASVKAVPINDAGELDMEAFANMIGPRTKMISAVHVSNALGTVNPVADIVKLGHEQDVPVMIDGAQAAPHIPIDVQSMGADFYAISGHKMYGPTGIGILYGKEEHLDAMVPYQGGGEMIASVTFEKTTFNELPHKFEAGTPHIAGAIGLGAAADYMQRVGIQAIAEHEHRLLELATKRVSELEKINIVGTARDKASVLSFTIDGIHPHDVGSLVDHEGVAIRTGHHCAQPVMDHFGLPATNRASFGLYNTEDEVDRLIHALETTIQVFS
jgi:cysteine desulfurase/selenocysteine lyase